MGGSYPRSVIPPYLLLTVVGFILAFASALPNSPQWRSDDGAYHLMMQSVHRWLVHHHCCCPWKMRYRPELASSPFDAGSCEACLEKRDWENTSRHLPILLSNNIIKTSAYSIVQQYHFRNLWTLKCLTFSWVALNFEFCSNCGLHFILGEIGPSQENQNIGIQKERATAFGAAFRLPAILEVVLL